MLVNGKPHTFSYDNGVLRAAVKLKARRGRVTRHVLMPVTRHVLMPDA
jgi:hypothetical protein